MWQQPDGRGCTAAELDRQIERFLGDALGRDVDFEVGDALAKLLRLGLARQAADGRFFSTPAAESLRALDRAWDNYFAFSKAA
jgi:hypothetical protein